MRKLIVICFSLLSLFVSAQQLPHFSQYMINDYVLNPAIAGKNNYFLGMSANRYQWKGITDAPRTYNLSLHGPLKFNHMAIGSQLFTDNVGPTRRTGFYLSYAYHAPLTEKIKLSFGISAGILQFMVDGHKINLHDPGDLTIMNSVQSVLSPDFNAGFYLYSDRFWIGFSGMQLQQSKLKFFDYMSGTTSVLNRHYYGMAGYRLPVGDDFVIEPSVMTKYVKPAPFQFDAGLRMIYQDKVWIGGAYRLHDAASAFIGYIFRENLQFGYAFDFTTTNIRNYSSGTHELIIAIRFNKNGIRGGTSSAPQFN
ncbi:MAG: type IX secretion system membrane protein PorP/SprF [Bacteroidia bacterium]